MAVAASTDAVLEMFAAFTGKDREKAEALLAGDFTFTSPYDDHIGRDEYFRRCWPNSDLIKAHRIEKVVADGADVFVLYEAEATSGATFRNTERFRVEGGKIRAVEVFFGDPPRSLPKDDPDKESAAAADPRRI
jgi:ketosteroid isomerase-like protein